jgi:prepilin-type N-terminal cleavage/methylation domain-containing protein
MQSRRAFTLVEVLIVVVVLGILAAIVVPQFSNASSQAAIGALQSTLHTIQTQIEYQRQRNGTSEYPATIEAEWFVSSVLPKHPQNVFGVPTFEIVNTADLDHPANKVLQSGVGGAFWYNRATGAVRARVADEGSSAATMEAYNKVNNCTESSLGNYSGGQVS